MAFFCQLHFKVCFKSASHRSREAFTVVIVLPFHPSFPHLFYLYWQGDQVRHAAQLLIHKRLQEDETQQSHHQDH